MQYSCHHSYSYYFQDLHTTEIQADCVCVCVCDDEERKEDTRTKRMTVINYKYETEFKLSEGCKNAL